MSCRVLLPLGRSVRPRPHAVPVRVVLPPRLHGPDALPGRQLLPAHVFGADAVRGRELLPNGRPVQQPAVQLHAVLPPRRDDGGAALPARLLLRPPIFHAVPARHDLPRGRPVPLRGHLPVRVGDRVRPGPLSARLLLRRPRRAVSWRVLGARDAAAFDAAASDAAADGPDAGTAAELGELRRGGGPAGPPTPISTLTSTPGFARAHNRSRVNMLRSHARLPPCSRTRTHTSSHAAS